MGEEELLEAARGRLKSSLGEQLSNALSADQWGLLDSGISQKYRGAGSSSSSSSSSSSEKETKTPTTATKTTKTKEPTSSSKATRSTTKTTRKVAKGKQPKKGKKGKKNRKKKDNESYPSDPYTLFQEASDLVAKGGHASHQRAAGMYRHFIKLYPHIIQGYLNLAAVLERDGDFRGAARAYSRAQARAANGPEASEADREDLKARQERLKAMMAQAGLASDAEDRAFRSSRGSGEGEGDDEEDRWENEGADGDDDGDGGGVHNDDGSGDNSDGEDHDDDDDDDDGNDEDDAAVNRVIIAARTTRGSGRVDDALALLTEFAAASESDAGNTGDVDDDDDDDDNNDDNDGGNNGRRRRRRRGPGRRPGRGHRGSPKARARVHNEIVRMCAEVIRHGPLEEGRRKLELAKTHLMQAMVLDPNGMDSNANAGALYTEGYHFDEAVGFLRKALKRARPGTTDHLQIRRQLASALGRAGPHAESVDIARGIADELPHSSESHQLVFTLLTAMTRTSTEAVAAERKACALVAEERGSQGPTGGATPTGSRSSGRKSADDGSASDIPLLFAELSTSLVRVPGPVIMEGKTGAAAYTDSQLIGCVHRKCGDLVASYLTGDDAAPLAEPSWPAGANRSWPLVPLTTSKPQNHYHMLAEGMTRLWVADAATGGRANFVVPPPSENQQSREVLDLYGLPEARRVVYPGSRQTRARFPDGLTFVDYATQDDLASMPGSNSSGGSNGSGQADDPTDLWTQYHPPRGALRGLSRHLRARLLHPAHRAARKEGRVNPAQPKNSTGSARVVATPDGLPLPPAARRSAVLYIKRKGIREVDQKLEKRLLKKLRAAIRRFERQQTGRTGGGTARARAAAAAAAADDHHDDTGAAVDDLDTDGSRGLRVFDASGLSMAAQAELFAGARVILGPHGAGLTNMLFAPAGTQVIELPMRPHVNRCFGYLAHALGHRYWVVPEFRSYYHTRYEKLPASAIDAVVKTTMAALREASSA
eukprot:g462.t1